MEPLVMDKPHLGGSGSDPSSEVALECGYRNASDRMVIVRCCGPTSFFLERVVFPFELLSFQCPPESEVEIWTHGIGGPELVESLQAEDICMATGSPPDIADPEGGTTQFGPPW